MPRVKLTPLDTYDFSWSLPVRTSDMNYADHLAAYALVGMLDEVYVRFLRHIGLGQPGLGAPNVNTINADLQVNYLGEGNLHDELTAELGVREVSTKSFRVHYRFTHHGRPIALAEVGMVCFDYAAKRPTALPQPFLDVLERTRSSA